MSVFVTGDIHGHHDIGKLNSSNFKEGRNLTKEDFVIILGDFGLVFNNERTTQEQHWLDWLNDKKWTTLFFRGNHDNEPKLNSDLKEVQMFGGTVSQIDDLSIYRLLDGYSYVVDQMKFLILGGAFSIDKYRRTEGRDWWPTEEMTFLETKQAFETLKENNFSFDYILTHDAPSHVKDVLFSHHTENSYTNRFLDEVFLENPLEFKHHYFGHHHQDRTVFEKHTCCYQKIIELKR